MQNGMGFKVRLYSTPFLPSIFDKNKGLPLSERERENSISAKLTSPMPFISIDYYPKSVILHL